MPKLFLMQDKIGFPFEFYNFAQKKLSVSK